MYEALRSAGLMHYYDLRNQGVAPVGDLHLERRDHKWLEPWLARIARTRDAVEVRAKVQGVRCAACVWLIEQLFHRHAGARGLWLNPASGRLSMTVTSAFPLQRFVTKLEQLGYLVGQAQPEQAHRSDGLLLRAGLTTALALNAMMFSAAIYLGLPHGPLRSFLHSVNYALTALSVVIGAPVFAGQALASLRSRVLHLDLPVALGISLGFVAATWAFVTGHEEAAYYDSLAAFIALMLWGRYLRDRIIERNRAQLLSYEADDGLLVRRLAADRVDDVPAKAVIVGDRLLLAPGDIAPVDSILERHSAVLSLDWINGEPEPLRVPPGADVPAGAVNVGDRPALVRACQAYAASAMVELLAMPQARTERVGPRSARFAPHYVLSVFAAAAFGFAMAFQRDGRIAAGLAAATAVCVVSCPCAVGLAIPLAQELLLAKLRRIGLFVRDPSFLFRAAAVDAIAFDKTGTLTTGFLEVSNLQALAQLRADDRRLLYSLAAGSAHPHALAIRRTLERYHPHDARLTDHGPSTELSGEGIECSWQGRRYRLGRAEWACGRVASEDAAGSRTVLSCDGVQVCELAMREVPRPAVAEECRRLQGLGYRLYLMSGDAKKPVHALARALGIHGARVFSGQRPEDKAAHMACPEHERTLMLGDGINDNLALERAYAAGTPSVDRPAVSTRADFYYVAAGLAPVTAALIAARDLRRLRHVAYAFFAFYNACAVAAAMAGLIQPWTAAVLMPSSSVVSVVAVVAAVRRGSRRWMS